MRSGFLFTVAMSLVLVCTGSSIASFSDDFNSYAAPQLAITSLGDWRVYDGTVDLVGDGTGYEYYPLGQVYYIDLVGDSGTPGVLWTPGVPFSSGSTWNFEVKYKLAGRQVQPSADEDEVVLKVGVSVGGPGPFPGTGVVDDEWQTHTVPWNQTFTEYQGEFSLVANFDGCIHIGFYNRSIPFGDVGALLDDVMVDGYIIPAPGALLLAGIGTSVVTWLRKRSVF